MAFDFSAGTPLNPNYKPTQPQTPAQPASGFDFSKGTAQPQPGKPQAQGIFSRMFSGLESLGGKMENTAVALGSPITQGLATIRATNRGIANLGAYGIAKAFGKNDVASRIMDEEARAQKADVTGPSQYRPPQTARETVGLGTKLGVMAFAPGSIELGLGTSPLAAGGAGAISGGIYGAGQGLQTSGEKHLSAGQTVLKTTFDSALGAATGFVSGTLLGTLAQKTRQGEAQASESSLEQTGLEKSKEALAPSGTQQAEINADKILKTAVKEGHKVTDVNLITGMETDDLAAGAEMIRRADDLTFVDAKGPRPGELVSKPVVDAISQAQKLRTRAGKMMEDALTVGEGKQVDLTKVSNDFADKITKDKVQITTDDEGNSVLDFSKSAYKNLPEVKKYLSDLWETLQPNQADGTTLVESGEAHAARMGLRLSTNLGKTKGELMGRPQSILEDAYAQMGQSLDEALPGYGPGRRQYELTSRTLEAIEKIMGTKLTDASEANQALKITQIARRMFSNADADSRAALEALDELFPGLSGKVYDREALNLIIENAWKLTPETSLRGQETKAAQDAVETGAHVLSHNILGLLNKVIEFSQGVSPELKRKALKQLIEAALQVR